MIQNKFFSKGDFMKTLKQSEIAELLNAANAMDKFTDDNGYVYLAKNKAVEKLEQLQIEEYGVINEETTLDVLDNFSECVSILGRIYYPEILLTIGFYNCTGLIKK